MILKPDVWTIVLAIILQAFVEGDGGSTLRMPNLVIAFVDQNPYKPGFERTAAGWSSLCHGISMLSSKIRANHNQIILSILLHSADYGDVFDLSYHKE